MDWVETDDHDYELKVIFKSRFRGHLRDIPGIQALRFEVGVTGVGLRLL